MDFERGFEGSPQDKKIGHESGYSEEEQAQDIEAKAFDIKNMKKRKPMPTAVSRKDAIIAEYRKNTEAILQLVQSVYELNGANIRQEEQIVMEIKKLRELQEELLNALILEQKGMLTPESISKMAWDLIE